VCLERYSEPTRQYSDSRSLMCPKKSSIRRFSSLSCFIACYVNFDPKTYSFFCRRLLREELRISEYHTVNQLVKTPFGFVFSFTNLCMSLGCESHLYIILSVHPSITGLRTRKASVGSCKQINRLSAILLSTAD